MSIIDDYLRQIRKRLSHLPLGEQEAVLTEIRDHLETEAAALRRADRTLSRDEAALRATHAFGAPEEIGVAYGAQTTVVHRTTGEVLLRVAAATGRAAGRGAKGVVKWTLISVLVLLGIGTIIAVAALFFVGDLADTFQDDIREAVPRPVYHYEGHWDVTDPQVNSHADTFQLGSRAKEIRIGFATSPEAGCLAIQLVSPSNQVTDINGNGCSATDKMLTITEQGTWTVRYTFAAYSGSVDVEAHAFETAPARKA